MGKLSGLINRINEVYQGDPWLGNSVKNVLNSVFAGAATSKNNFKIHSIASIAAHMLAWRKFLIKHLEGEKDYDVNQEESFGWREIDSNDETAWGSIVKALDESQQKLIELLKQRDDSFLQQQVAVRPYTYRYLIEGIIDHDIYHMGQIVLLNKIQAEINH